MGHQRQFAARRPYSARMKEILIRHSIKQNDPLRVIVRFCNRNGVI